MLLCIKGLEMRLTTTMVQQNNCPFGEAFILPDVICDECRLIVFCRAYGEEMYSSMVRMTYK